MDFLHPDNVAGRTLLTLVARGSAIISELLRLSEHIPQVFLAGTPLAQGGQPGAPAASSSGGGAAWDARYEKILIDFRYLKEPERYDNIIDNDLVSAPQREKEMHAVGHGGKAQCAIRGPQTEL
jgi:WASH complex subunit strumpellin